MSGTPSSEVLREPERWGAAPGRRAYVSVTAAVLLTVASFAIAVYEYSVGEAGFGTGGLCFGVLFGLMLVVAIDGQFCFRKSTSTPRMSTTPDGRAALLIPYSNVQFICTVFVMIYVGFIVLLFGFLVTVGGGVTINAGVIVFAIVACVFWSLPVLVLLGRFRRGWFALSSEGIYQRGWTFEAYAPWSSITTIDPLIAHGPTITALVSEHAPQWRRTYFTRLWRQDQVPKTPPMLVFAAKDLGINIVLVYHLLNYYYHYPTSRTELSTGAALDRAQNANFA